MNLPDSSRAIDFFMLYFTEEIIGKVVEFTNKNAQSKGLQNWRPTTAVELKAFLALLIISNDIIFVPRDKRFFLSSAETRLFQIPGFKNVLSSRKRFFKLKSYIFFCKPEHQHQRKRGSTCGIKCKVFTIPSFRNSRNSTIAHVGCQLMKPWCHSKERWLLK